MILLMLCVTVFVICVVWFLLSIVFFSSRRRHTRLQGDWSSDVCSSDLQVEASKRRCARSGCSHCRYSSRGRLSAGSSAARDRKSTRLNSSHLVISYAVFCLKKKNITEAGVPVIAHRVTVVACDVVSRGA